jgi:hypothetical protein
MGLPLILITFLIWEKRFGIEATMVCGVLHDIDEKSEGLPHEFFIFIPFLAYPFQLFYLVKLWKI